jgi:hypothetical protein
MNRYEKREANREKLRTCLHGEGLYLYENTSSGDLYLPKPLPGGQTVVAPKKQFEGDNYYMKLVGSGLKIVQVIRSPEAHESLFNEEVAMNDKLILDQPNTITNEGQVEHVVKKAAKVQPINDNHAHKPQQVQPQVLINEDPISGVDILLG